MSEEYLVHHGILGMKWGIRRYQNKDGTLTAAGKKHYSNGGKSDGRAGVSREDVKNMSDDELRNAINRLRMEAEYIKMTSPEANQNAKKGESYVKAFLKDKGRKLASQYVDAAITSFVNRKFSGNKNSDDSKFNPMNYIDSDVTIGSLKKLSNNQREEILKAQNQMKSFNDKSRWSNVYEDDGAISRARREAIREASEKRKEDRRIRKESKLATRIGYFYD